MNKISDLLNQFNLIAVFQGFLLVIALLFLKKGNRSVNRILAITLLMFSWSGYYYTLDFMGKFLDYPYIAYTNFISDFMYNPLIYIYVLSITERNYRITGKTLLHFIPAALMFFYYFNFYFAPLSTREAIMQRGYNYFPWDVAVFSYANLLQLIIYITLIVVVIVRYRKKIVEFYSDIEKRTYNWLAFILVVNTTGAIFCFFFYGTMADVWNRMIGSVSSLFIYAIGYKMLSAPPHLPETESVTAETDKISSQPSYDNSQPKYERTGLSEEKAKQAGEKLMEVMKSGKPYLEPELNLKQLADQMHVPAHQLSQVINQQFGKNFYDFVNAFRVEEVKSRIQNAAYANLTLLAIAFDSGFRSKAAFNSVFKKVTGVSPSEYKREVSRELKTVEL